MMHGAEKSGLVIVAGKPANKAEQPAPEGSAAMLNAAEPVERRAGTKGNADQQSTCRQPIDDGARGLRRQGETAPEQILRVGIAGSTTVGTFGSVGARF